MADFSKLAACRSGHETSVAAKLKEVEVLIDRGEKTRAEARLRALDARFGGLAAPRSVELASRL